MTAEIVIIFVSALFWMACGFWLSRLTRKPRPHVHRFYPVAITLHSPPVAAMAGAVPVTIVLRRCQADGELDTITLQGTWTLADLAPGGELQEAR
jgi:hypothetical protein